MSEQHAEPVTERLSPPPIAGRPVDLPDLRRKGRSGPGASPDMAAVHTHAYTRGEAPPKHRNRRPSRRDSASLPGWLRMVLGLVGGADLWFTQPRSLSQAWELHGHSARYFEAGMLRWPRYLWAAVHLPIAGLIYLLVWATSTVPRALALGALIALLVWWPF